MTAFNTKNNSELKRAYFLFKLISNKPLVKIGTALTNFALKTNLPIDRLVKSTVFDHFCGGISIIDCKPKINKMLFNNKSILDKKYVQLIKKNTRNLWQKNPWLGSPAYLVRYNYHQYHR